VPISIAAVGAHAPPSSSARTSRVDQQNSDSGGSFQPVLDNASKPAASAPVAAKSTAAKDDSSTAQSSGDAKQKLTLVPKNVKNSDPATKKADPSPVVLAPDPTPQPVEAKLVLKTPEAQPEQTPQVAPSTPQITAQPAPILETFVLPQPATPAPSANVAIPTAAVAPTDATQNSGQAPVDPGNLVFQLTINPTTINPTTTNPTTIDPTTINPTTIDSNDGPATAQPSSGQTDNKANQSETPTFQMPVAFSLATEAHTGGSSSDARNDTKNQDQPQQPLPTPQPSPALQALPSGTDSTIASQFGFQTPLAFATHVTAPKVDATAPVAPTRPVENVSTPDLPSTGPVDRIALTIRGVNDQVVRVEINQSGETVQVGVNTANTDLAADLRVSVPELVHRLDQQGYESKVNIPSSSSFNSLTPIPIATAHTEFRSGADSNGNSKSNDFIHTQDEPRQQRQRSPQRAWRELASQLQED